MWSKKTKEQKRTELIAILTAFKKRTGRIPSKREVSHTEYNRVRSVFGSWDEGIVAAFGVHSRSRRRPDEELLNLVREQYKKLQCVPSTADVGKSMSNVLRKRFGAWHVVIKKALGVDIKPTERSDEELLQEIRTVEKKIGRIPTSGDLKSITKTIWHRFGSINAAIEKAIGTSMRHKVLWALDTLTPPSCEVATATEIAHELLVRQVKLASQQVGAILEEQVREGFVSKGMVGMRTCWKLTPAGREFVRK